MKPPRDFALSGMNRTIDFLRHKEIPIMGLVTMMDGYLCPSCGLVTHQLLSPKLAMEKGSQGLRGAAVDIHSASSRCGAIETLLRQTGEDDPEMPPHYTPETNPVAESSGKGWRVRRKGRWQVHVR